MKTSLIKKVFSLTLAIALALSMFACALPVEQSGLPKVDAAPLSDGNFKLATDYNQILLSIQAGLPAANEARPNAEVDDTKSSNQVAGADSQSRRVDGQRGYVYVADGESLDVREGSTSGKAVQTLNLYTYTNINGGVISLAYEGTTLAVLFATRAGLHYPSVDYALSAYNAPRSMILFFDATDANKLVFDKAIGMSGTPRAVAIRGGVVYVAATHKTTPDIAADGSWMTQGRNTAQVRGYASSLSLRSGDPESFVPSYFEDGILTPLRPSQIYLSEYGSLTIATVVGAFSLQSRSCVELFAFYDPGALEDRGLEIAAFGVDSEGFRFSYEVEYNNTPAIITVIAPINADGTLAGLGRVDWSEPRR
jgi:hypothetical protein